MVLRLQEELKKKEVDFENLKQEVAGLEKDKQEESKAFDKILAKDQREALIRGTTRGSKWSDETVKKALALRLACGSTGYEKLIKTGTPLPSFRTQQRRL